MTDDSKPCEFDDCGEATKVVCCICARWCCSEHRGWQRVSAPPFGIHEAAACDHCAGKAPE